MPLKMQSRKSSQGSRPHAVAEKNEKGIDEERYALPRDATIGVLGGGQLGRMFALAAARLGVKVMVLDPTEPTAPAAIAAEQISGSFRDSKSILEFAKQVDVLTVEIEHIDTDALQQAEDLGCDVQPKPSTLKIIQDKYNQKKYLERYGIPLPAFTKVSGEGDIDKVGDELGFPLMLKSRYLAYDGRGNHVVKNKEDFLRGVKILTENVSGVHDEGEVLYAEGWVPFVKELAVMVVRDREGHVVTYPVVETHHKDSILSQLECPANVPADIQAKAREVAKEAVSKFEGAGVFGVELFLLSDGSVLLNEIAPRPHNSGHYTIEACVTSQFEQHVRSILGWSLGDTSMTCGSCTMINILGEASGEEGQSIANSLMSRALSVPGAYPHWYGKEGVKPGRKIGHITITAPTLQSALEKTSRVLAKPADTQQIAGFPSESSPQVAVIMGSDSDLYVMKDAAQVLTDFGIPAQVTVVSAHRTPERMFEFARNAHKRGIKVIIAGAGGAAHLPGMVASMTPLPVIGVPVIPKGAALDGMDSLLSIVQMPRGIPVATVAIQNATNAGLLAVRIIGSADPTVLDKMQSYQDGLKEMVEKKAARLEEEGWSDYQT